ncbi:ROK family protein [Exiguobacterium sp. s144]|uniref:ROK family protein n=1 Tax=Exiguobacterium sp. s144 TaxID=2751195 RepID=UPI001BE9AE2A|nr:ROK family protein [Exiguobacterium sp. s144]
MTELISRTRHAFLVEQFDTIPAIRHVLDVSFPTASKQIDLMIDAREIEETPLELVRGGRPAKRYRYRADHFHGLALYLERTYLQYRIHDVSGHLIATDRLNFDSSDHGSVLLKTLTTLLNDHPSIQTLAIGVAGAVDTTGTILFAPDYPTLDGRPLQQELTELFKRPVIVENDMNTAVRAQASDNETTVYVYLGTNGPGAGIAVSGHVVRGAHHFAGEISFIPFDEKRNVGQVLATTAPYSDDWYEALCRIILSFSVTLNPDVILFTASDVSDDGLARLTERCAKRFPLDKLPRLRQGDWETDYLDGLMQLSIQSFIEQIPLGGLAR